MLRVQVDTVGLRYCISRSAGLEDTGRHSKAAQSCHPHMGTTLVWGQPLKSSRCYFIKLTICASTSEWQLLHSQGHIGAEYFSFDNIKIPAQAEHCQGHIGACYFSYKNIKNPVGHDTAAQG